MQYYSDGFYPGDPAVEPEAPGTIDRTPGLPDAVDVLIVGSGPAGLVLAAQLARFPGISTRVVERRTGPMEMGQADGVACRTVEMFQAFGFAHRILAEAYWVNEVTFWRPDAAKRDEIVRTGRVRDVEEGLSEMPHLIMNQARVHEYLLDAMRNAPSRLEPDYGLEVLSVEVEDEGDHPVTVVMRDVATGATETVRARYVVGCDGARSRVRTSIGRALTGDRANHAWGVMDILATTDFPDIRFKAAIQSAEEGSILLIPREGGHLVRLYVDLGTVTEDTRDAIRAMTAADVLDVAERVLHPYTVDVKETVWFSVYEVAQRITDAFDDAAGRDRAPRVFIAGDACHTHSAKAGQGMNVSMQDAFNLGWKLAAVLTGRSDASLLETYDAERRPIAQDLIDFDREWSAMLASSPEDSAELPEYFQQQGRYTAGVATRYAPSRLTGRDIHQELATGFPVGMRFHSAPVVRIGDGKRVELGHAHTADGRWRLYAFADASGARFAELASWLVDAAESPLVRHRREGEPIDAVIDVRGILPGPAESYQVGELPAVLRPAVGRLGLTDYEKAYAASGGVGSDLIGADIFERRGIDRERGALVVVRPDQYVAQVLPLDAYAEVAGYFDDLLVVPRAITGSLG